MRTDKDKQYDQEDKNKVPQTSLIYELYAYGQCKKPEKEVVTADELF